MALESVISKTTDLRSISHEELLAQTRALAQNERRITLSILHHLAEIDRRRAYAKLGYPSLWDYVLKELKYSESAAYRRISAMRALKDQPELEEKIREGTLTVTAVSQVQSFFKAERDRAFKTYSPGEKAALFKKCENKSTREVTRELLSVSPHAFRVQKERVITEDRTMISFVADTDLLKKIHRVRDLSVPRLHDPASYSELVGLMSEVTLDEIDPLRKPLRKMGQSRKGEMRKTQEVPEGQEGPAGPHLLMKTDQNVALIAPKPTQNINQTAIGTFSTQETRAISPALRTKIWQQYDGKCAFVDAETGRRCNSTFGLEIEHCQPYSMGGSSKDPSNLRLLCRHHNQWQAIQSFGLSKIEQYLKPKKS